MNESIEPAAKRLKVDDEGGDIACGGDVVMNFVDTNTPAQTYEHSHTVMSAVDVTHTSEHVATDVTSIHVPEPTPVTVAAPVADPVQVSVPNPEPVNIPISTNNDQGASTSLSVNDPVAAADTEPNPLNETAQVIVAGVPASLTMPEPTPVVGTQMHVQHQPQQVQQEHHAAATTGVSMDVNVSPVPIPIQVPVPGAPEMPPLISPALVPTSVPNVNMDITTVNVPQPVPAPVGVDVNVNGAMSGQHHQVNVDTNAQVSMNIDVQPVPVPGPVAMNLNPVVNMPTPTPILTHEAAMEQVAAAAPASNTGGVVIATNDVVQAPAPIQTQIHAPEPAPPAMVSVSAPATVAAPAATSASATVTPAVPTTDPTAASTTRPAHTLPSTDPAYRRKDKSLGVLCANFMRRYNKIQQERTPEANAVGPPEVTIDEASQSLMVERRRIYDIINILEAIEVVQRKGKNTYTFYGMTNINFTLRKMQQEAFTLFPQDVIANGLHEVTKEKEEAEAAAKAAAEATAAAAAAAAIRQDGSVGDAAAAAAGEAHLNTGEQPQPTIDGAEGDANIPTGFAMLLASAEQVEASKKKKPKTKKGASKEKSLGRLSQKFIQLFLVGNPTITLEEASDKILGKTDLPQPPPDATAEEILKIRNSNNKMIKTKIRRLYDIANIMASVGLIAKMSSDNPHVGSAPRSRPSFRWIYPLTAKQILLGENGEVTVNDEKRNVVQDHFGMVVNGGLGNGVNLNMNMNTVNTNAGTEMVIPVAAPSPAAVPINVNITPVSIPQPAPVPSAINDNVNVHLDDLHPTSMTLASAPPQPINMGVDVNVGTGVGAVTGNSTETELAQTAAEAAAAAVENISTHDDANVADVNDVAAAAAAEAVAAAEAEAEVVDVHVDIDAMKMEDTESTVAV